MRPDRPRASVAMCTHNHERFVADAMTSVLAQRGDPIELVISDDASTDRTFTIAESIASAYRGPHAIILHRNETNQGFAGNLNTVTALTTGDLVIFSSGDDMSEPDRATKLLDLYEASGGTACAIYSNAMVIDADGQEEGLLHSMPPSEDQLTILAEARGSGAGLFGAFSAFDRRVFDLFAPLGPRVKSEDRVYTFRAALLGDIRYIDEPLVRYRNHGENMGLTSYRDIENGQHYLALVDRHTESMIAVHETQLADLETAAERGLQPAAVIEQARREIEANLRDKRVERELFQSGLMRRVRLIAAAATGQTRLRRIARWILWFFLPTPYVMAQKARSRVLVVLDSWRGPAVRYWRP